jgi:hypothetical protein
MGRTVPRDYESADTGAFNGAVSKRVSAPAQTFGLRCYSPTFGVLDFASLLDRILDGIPDRIDRRVELFPFGPVHISIVLWPGEKLDMHRRPRPALEGFLLVQVEVFPFRDETILGLGLPGNPLAEHFHHQVELNHALEGGAVV